MSNKFKGPNSKWLTDGLFFERTEPSTRGQVLYTLKEEDHLGYKSLYKLYMEEMDIHEVNFARKYLGGYKHWKVLCDSPWFKEYIMEWREELELILMSQGLGKIKEALGSERLSDAVFAAKFFANRGWDEGIHKNPNVDSRRGRGRPSKKGLQDKLSSQDGSSSDNNQAILDLKRMLEGGK